MIRHLPLEGVENFRDFGGYATASGRRLRAGRLFRSASHGRATDADLEAIAALEIAVVIDLRRREERERDPSRRHGAFAGEVIVSDIGEEEVDSWVAHMTAPDLSEASVHAYLLGYYAQAPLNPRIAHLYRRYFERLSRAGGPMLIHCAAGKDRTGILVALTHHLAGVHPDDMMADYLATNDPERIARRLPMVAESIRELSGREPPEAAVRVAMGVAPDYLHAAWAAMAGRHGDVDGYLERELGIDKARRAALEERLLE
ncbi:MAG TPA: tyrosine-protein phosphatase [Caulobacteraceae bacterium]